MKKNNILILKLIIIFSFYFVGCNKNFDKEESYITKITTNNSVVEYEYNKRNLIVAEKTADGEVFRRYEYNSKDKVKKSYSNTGYSDYEYNSAGQLDKQTYYHLDMYGLYVSNGYTDFFYNDNGYLIRMDNFWVNGEKYSSEEYIYDNIGNVTNYFHYELEGFSPTTLEKEYTYGNEKNPYINISLPKRKEMIGVNNYLTVKSIYHFGEDNSYTNYLYQYDYFFNEKGYPTTRTNNGDDYTIFEYK